KITSCTDSPTLSSCLSVAPPAMLKLVLLALLWCLAARSGADSIRRSPQYWLPAFSDAAPAGGDESRKLASGFYRIAYWRSFELLPTDEAGESTAALSWLTNRCRSESASDSVAEVAKDDSSAVQLLADSHLQKAGNLLLWPMADYSSPTSSPIVTIVPVVMQSGGRGVSNSSNSYGYNAPSPSTQPSSEPLSMTTTEAPAGSNKLAFLHVSRGRLGLQFSSIGRASLIACTVRSGADGKYSAPLAVASSSPLLSACLLLTPVLAALTLALSAGFVCWTWRRSVRPSLASALAAATSAATAASSCSLTDSWRCPSHQQQQHQVSFAVPPPLSFQQRCLPRARSTPYSSCRQQKLHQQQQHLPMQILSGDSVSHSNAEIT
uniref:Conserved plasma membrane protein n=2 Tax=Macrostomum lignano TaxID=282301 RepID=A0A1I8GBY8_9PLAT